MSRTRKPCPGCGEVWHNRKPEEVCRECRRLLDRVKEIEELEKSGKDNLIGVRFGERYHWNQYIYTRGAFNSDEIMRAFHRLAMAAAKPSINSYYSEDDLTLLGKYSHGAGARYLMDKDIAEAIRDLRNLIQPLIDSAYTRGKEDGHNLLMRLAAGDLAPNEYLKKTAEEEEE